MDAGATSHELMVMSLKQEEKRFLTLTRRQLEFIHEPRPSGPSNLPLL